MIYLVTALYHEASPFIKKYGLKKNPDFGKIEVFENEKIRLIISGTGKVQSAIAVSSVISLKNDADKIINIGICGAAEPDFAIGDMFLVHEVRDFSAKKRYYPDILYDFQIAGAAVTTFDKPLVEHERKTIADKLEIVDMEASGFYEAAVRHVTAEKIQILKIVSDHLEDIRCTPQLVADIFEKNLQMLDMVIMHNTQKTAVLSEEECNFLEKLIQTLRFTQTQRHSFLDMAKSYKIRTGNDFSILHSYLDLEVKQKNQSKDHFETIRSLLFA